MGEMVGIEWQVQRQAPGQPWVNYGAAAAAGQVYEQAPASARASLVTDRNASTFAHGVAQQLRSHLDSKGKTAEQGWRVRVLRIEQHAEDEY